MRFLKTLPGLAMCGLGITILMNYKDTAIIQGAIGCLMCCVAGVAITVAIFFKPKPH